MAKTTSEVEALRDCLERLAPVAIAVSGGVDSVTLAEFAFRERIPVKMVHAVSPAVPAAATERLARHANSAGWDFSTISAGELADSNYRKNPINRCYFCKNNLYQAISELTDAEICSGANTDDLGDFRPGLLAAKEHRVHHPFIDAAMGKADIRRLARNLGLTDFADLPASPCLSSRVETGVMIEEAELRLIDEVETWLRQRINAPDIRCRRRSGGLVFELSPNVLSPMPSTLRREMIEAAKSSIPALRRFDVSLEPYQRGSAFVGDKRVSM